MPLTLAGGSGVAAIGLGAGDGDDGADCGDAGAATVEAAAAEAVGVGVGAASIIRCGKHLHCASPRHTGLAVGRSSCAVVAGTAVVAGEGCRRRADR